MAILSIPRQSLLIGLQERLFLFLREMNIIKAFATDVNIVVSDKVKGIVRKIFCQLGLDLAN